MSGEQHNISTHRNKCRVCLKPGDIPIFGNNDSSLFHEDISTDVNAIGDIKVYHNDNLPKHLCVTCYKLLQGAIFFRKTAKQSDILLRNLNDNLLSSDFKDSFSSANENRIAEFEASDMSVTDIDEMKLEILSNDELSYNSQTNGKSKKITNESQGKEIIMRIVSNSDKESIQQNIEEHSCDVCAMDFESLYDYKQHTRTLSHMNTEKRSRNIQCHICEKEVKKINLRAHILHTHSEPTTLAKQVSIENIALDSHKALLHTEVQRECVTCHKLIGKTDFSNHFKEHSSEAEKAERNCECNNCHKSFTYYTDHIKKVHIRKNKNEDSISETDKKLNQVISKADLQTRYVCEICGKAFKRPYGFKLHVMTHGSELKYKCMFCPYKGLHQGLLKIHVRTHTGDYNYKCLKCPAQFTTKSNLNKHLNRHTGPVNFKCEICNKCFYSKPELDRHYNVHHLGIKKHVCNICGKAFGYRNAMMGHQLKVHKRQKLTQGKGRLPSYLQAEINKTEE